jgi:hypothetical protein
MRLVDEDFNYVQDSPYKRNTLYYTVKIDQRATNILGRKAHVPNNNATKLTFLINTVQGHLSYTNLYLSEVDIITLLSTLDDAAYEHIKGYLVEVYRKKTDPTAHSVQFDRTALVQDLESVSLTANRHVLAIPTYDNNPNIATPFGFTISFQSFCDVVSLILSTENEEKLKIIITKYCIFSTLLRPLPRGVYIPASLRHVATLEDIESIYASKRSQQIQKYDFETFAPRERDRYFGSI